MNDFRKNLILILCFIPFFRDLLRLLYNYALKKVKVVTEQHEQIVDVYLTSKMSDHDFIYGSSDLDLIFVVENTSHPRQILLNLRRSLQGVWPVNMLVDLNNLHVFKEAEIQTPLIRSYLNTKKIAKTVSWKSIISKKEFEFTLKEQDHFAIQRVYVKKLEIFLLTKVKASLLNRHWIRSFGKNVYRSINGLKEYGIIDTILSDSWGKYSKKIIGLSLFSRLYLNKVKVLTFKILDFEPLPDGKGLTIAKNYPERLNRLAQVLIEIDIVKDIVFSPALIQLKSEEVKGRIYIDLVMGHNNSNFSIESLNKITEVVTFFLNESSDDEPKYVFSYTTYAFMKLKAKYLLSENLLEHEYRYQNCHSLMDIKYNFTPNKKQLDKAAIYFLLSQFMRFRSMEYKTDLIGSRFIKSLNIIYSYQILLHHLQQKEFAISHSYKSIMEELTPQLSNVKPDDEVTVELWQIIRAQMLFYLKQIRDQLAKKEPSLKNLQF